MGTGKLLRRLAIRRDECRFVFAEIALRYSGVSTACPQKFHKTVTSAVTVLGYHRANKV